jgi:hypothetical protein
LLQSLQGSRKRDAPRPDSFDQIHADLVQLLRHRARPLRPLVGYLTDIIHSGCQLTVEENDH